MTVEPQERERFTDGDVILRTEGLVRKFGEFTATDHVDLAVERGECRSIIGPNGAGKTTLFNLITGALSVTDGTIYFDGEEVTDLSPPERVRRGMGRSFQISNVFGGLTVRENVRLAAQSVSRDEYSLVESLFKPTDSYDGMNEETERILTRIGLENVAEEEADALAYGNRRRLEIGVVLATDPDIVLFDEPTAGMSVEETQETIDLIEEVLVDQTLLLIEHDIELVMELSDRITVLHRGQILAEGTPEDIAGNQAVQDAYLGGMAE
ncbi:ABC transporter ATP-binding protein [Natronobacterium gregoryi]|uniref:Probable branched-chain amino acid transport ATP-binding protein LivG n=2 Tax=Natronobacterium gregoryi TaxID=44930 RepID=L0AGB9_NATGS|nr:ABC transporter ATP-binding protein [Natronobacterium gregoryi]AFZ72464.1 ABC-type branched-chain amino acid transport systems, ATPase component [Natronobacterium gregoryi SP2]ELY74334.1 ABC transporter [Natronobacterium gregoryi SP2]PLK21436.1 ABC transporter ATP-binding protein [Natronobacterium gregoryi SP2]SFI77871.1 amino acid/amide ABC transporter ATP-binding protein 1, HAAT family [Natronobacterium gregoryi]